MIAVCTVRKQIFLETLHLVARWLAPLPGSKKVLSSNLGLGAFRRGVCMFSHRLCEFHMFQSVFFTDVLVVRPTGSGGCLSL